MSAEWKERIVRPSPDTGGPEGRAPAATALLRSAFE
jgi:hypothetical protein